MDMITKLTEEDQLELFTDYSENLLTPEKFSSIIEKRVIEVNGSFIEETCQLFEEYDLEPSEHLTLISKTLLEKIKNEASKNRLIKEENNTIPLTGLFS